MFMILNTVVFLAINQFIIIDKNVKFINNYTQSMGS